MHHDIDLGVTGLRRTGKTVFLTSLIYQLEQLGSEGLNAFENRGVTLWPAKIAESNDHLPAFPYQENLAQLRSPTPTWPERNLKEYVCELELVYQKRRQKRLNHGTLLELRTIRPPEHPQERIKLNNVIQHTERLSSELNNVIQLR